MSLFSVITTRIVLQAPSAPPTYFGFAAAEEVAAVSACVVTGPRGTRAGKLAAIVLAIGLPGLAPRATAQSIDTGSITAGPVPPVAPDPRTGANSFQVSQTLPPEGLAPAAPGGNPGPAGDTGPAPARKWRIELGSGPAFGPKYPGSGQIAATPAPLVSVTYDERYFVSSRDGIGAYVVRTPNFRLGASIGVDTDTRYTGKDARLRGLPKIKPGGEASLFAAYDLGPLAVAAAVHERIGPVNGVSATLGATYRVRLTENWSVSAGPELKFQSASLNDAFFGVTEAASLNAAAYGNAIRPYRPGAGIEQVSATIASRYRASAHWTLLARADLGVLVGRDGRSPITRERFQPEVGVFAIYGF